MPDAPATPAPPPSPDAPPTAADPNALPPTRRPAFRPVVLLPTYNNAPKLADVLDGVAALSLPMILVNDGSTDGTVGVLDKWFREQRAAHRHPYLQVLHHARNRGKGAALRTGFDAAAAHGYTHALAIDTDGQHDPADAPRLLAAAAASPTALVLGSRDAADPDYPRRSRVGRTWANLTILLSSGLRVEDSQCGYRVYPLGLVQTVRCLAGRYGYEGEILIRSGWARCPLIEVPIRVIYPPEADRISHYRPWRDSIHTYLVYALLSLRAILPYPFVKWPPSDVRIGPLISPAARGRRDNTPTPTPPTPPADPPPPQPRKRPPRWKRLLRWLDPRDLIHLVRRDRVSQMAVAAGVGVGVFVANLPIYPLQTLAALYLARRLHVHPVATVLGTQIALPPLCFALIAAAIYLGRLILTGQPPTLEDFDTWRNLSLADLHALLRDYFLAWCLGGLLLGLALGWLTFLTLLAIFRFIPVQQPEQP